MQTFIMRNFLRNLALSALIVTSAVTVNAEITHEVKRGETLWGISHKYKVSADDIIALNPNLADGLKHGMVIKIPYSNEASDSINSGEPKTVTVVEPKPHYEATPSQIINMENPTIAPSRGLAPGEDTYVVKFGDTFYSIAKKAGITVPEIIAYNPTLESTDLHEGDIIRLSADAPFGTGLQYMTVVDSVVYRVNVPQPVASTSASALTSSDKAIAVMLPFDINSTELSRQSLLATEFYKGFLMATKENAKNIGYNLRIIAVDTQGPDTALVNKLSMLAADGVNVIVPPDDDRQLQIIEDFARDNGVMVLNVLNIKDEGYLTNPNVVQCNISQKLMYQKAIDALLTQYADYTPVVLDLAGGKDEKLSFIEELRERYSAKGKEIVDLSFNGSLQASDLAELSPDRKYIFIPKTGSVEVFDKFAPALAAFIDNSPDIERVKLFGYPDWVAFRGSSQDMLHRLGAVIYSRFYFDPISSNADEVKKDFRNWYGASQVDVFPSQGTLGFDAGNLLFRMLSNKWLDNLGSRSNVGSYNGIQSAFKLIKDPDYSGIINNSLYIIEFLPGTSTYVRVI